MKRAVFAGSFDPFTLGHKDIVLRATKLFDEVVVAIALDNGKLSRSLGERKKVAEISLNGVDGVRIECFEGLLTDFMERNGINVLVRGVRNSSDLDYERSLMSVYRSLNPNIEFALLPAKPELLHISSTVVRELCKIKGSLNGYVDTKAEEFVRKLYEE